MAETTAQTALIERLRDLLADETVLREVSMFGGRSFMVNDKMVVSARRTAVSWCESPADRHQELLERPGAEQAEMGAGRDMGPGWIEVDAASISDDEKLSSWIRVALEHNRTVTGRTR